MKIIIHQSYEITNVPTEEGAALEAWLQTPSGNQTLDQLRAVFLFGLWSAFKADTSFTYTPKSQEVPRG